MAIYLETNALRNLTNYDCDQHVYTSIFSIFELLSGINEEEFVVRQSCAKRIKKQKLTIKGPMIDKLFYSLIKENGYTPFAYKMINDTFRLLIKSKNYNEFSQYKLSITNKKGQKELINPICWLSCWDQQIAMINKTISSSFENEDKAYIKRIYKEQGEKGFAEYFWQKYYDERIDQKRLNHAEPFIGTHEIEKCKAYVDQLFLKYNFKLFMTAQAVIFAKSYFINGNTSDKNNPCDLLHLLYLGENDTLVSNDKIYQTIEKACEEFKLITINDEKSLSNLFGKIKA